MGWLKIFATQTDFTTGPLTVDTTVGLNLGAIHNATVTAMSFWDPSNTAFGLANLITNATPNGSFLGSVAGGSPYSITIEAMITATGAGFVSGPGGDITLTAVPEPATLLFLGFGLFGVGAARRKIKK